MIASREWRRGRASRRVTGFVLTGHLYRGQHSPTRRRLQVDFAITRPQLRSRRQLGHRLLTRQEPISTTAHFLPHAVRTCWVPTQTWRNSILTTSKRLPQTRRLFSKTRGHMTCNLREQRDILQPALIMNNTHTTVRAAVVAPELCGRVYVGDREVGSTAAADLVGDFGGGEVVCAEAWSGRVGGTAEGGDVAGSRRIRRSGRRRMLLGCRWGRG
jgi:hypothetical protein